MRFHDKNYKENLTIIVPDNSFKNKVIAHVVRLQFKDNLKTILKFTDGITTTHFDGALMVFGNDVPAQWLLALDRKMGGKLMVFDNDRFSREKYVGIQNREIKTHKTIARVLFEYFQMQENSWVLDYTDDKKLWLWPTMKQEYVKAGIESLSYNIEQLWKMDLTCVWNAGKDYLLKKDHEEEARLTLELKEKEHGKEGRTGDSGSNQNSSGGPERDISKPLPSGKRKASGSRRSPNDINNTQRREDIHGQDDSKLPEGRPAESTPAN